MSTKYVYLFTEGCENMSDLLGRKGANLAEIANIGFPVPHGFTITTEACTRYYKDNETISCDIKSEIFEAISKLEIISGKTFGDKNIPLIVSVRPGANVSMPGMMDTVLNLGLNDEIVQGIAKATGNTRFAYDIYSRFIKMFSNTVMDLPNQEFDNIVDEIKWHKDIVNDNELDTYDFIQITRKYKEYYSRQMGVTFPQDPKIQLIAAIKAVFRSWNNPRAIVYRRMNDIPYFVGTAVNIQEMVFGNWGTKSGAGVVYTRNPSTGQKELYGEYLMNAQGHDLVSGIRTPSPITEMKCDMPRLYSQLVEFSQKLEKYYKDIQAVGFTFENGRLFILSTHNAKRTAHAAVKIAVDLVCEGLLSKEEALLKVNPKQIDSLLHPSFNPEVLKAIKAISKGLPTSPGAAAGQVFFTSHDVVEASKRGEDAILVRLELSPEDIEGVALANGVLTAKGGMTSHASVVARALGKCCVSGANELNIYKENTCRIGETIIKKGDYISLDGTTGNIYIGAIEILPVVIKGEFDTFMSWAKRYSQICIRTNADIQSDVKTALDYGATDGIGHMRTEHMFFEVDRIKHMREFILADNSEQQKKALNTLLPLQKENFKEMFNILRGRPITIRLLDAPLHEFLPTYDHSERYVSKYLENSQCEDTERLWKRIIDLYEINPLIGRRGCRVYITYPELLEMQIKAIAEAAIEVKQKKNVPVAFEIAVPMVNSFEEVKLLTSKIKDIINKACFKATHHKTISGIRSKIGIVLQTPRAALVVDKIAPEVDFILINNSFLTQLTYGISRDDYKTFLDTYNDIRIFESDPFVRIDEQGVGKLIKMVVEVVHKVAPTCKVGIFGEQASNPASINFFVNCGISFISCPPLKVPIAQLAVAQSEISKHSGMKNARDI